MNELFTTSALMAFATLTALEIVLGVDNVVFIAVLSGKLPESQRGTARRTGLLLAALGRVILLIGITWVISLQHTQLFQIDSLNVDISAKDLILVLGGLFLLAKGTWEIHATLDVDHGQPNAGQTKSSFAATIGQIVLLDLVFSIDSVLTAVGMVRPESYATRWVPLTIMVAAIVVAIAVMMAFAGPLSRFIQNHPTMKMLALAFLLLIGVVLMAEGLHLHIPRGYIYFAMGFSLFVEVLNLKIVKRRRRKQPAS